MPLAFHIIMGLTFSRRSKIPLLDLSCMAKWMILFPYYNIIILLATKGGLKN